jgi:anaerobic magnesium-protoporphyrin IX monomethyl ester cyclase
MRVLIVYPNMGLEMTLNHGITALSAMAKRAGHEVRLLHLSTFRVARVLEQVQRAEPDVVTISLTENHRKQMEVLAREIKRTSDVPIFAGGPFPSAYPEWLEECESLDGVCYGEGDLAFVTLLDKLSRGEDHTDTLGFWFRKGKTVVKNQPHPLLDDLDELPFPDLEIFDRRTILNYPAFSFSRGCPFKCTYCCAPLYGQRETGSTAVRYKSPERAVAEVEDMLRRYDPPVLTFDDDTFFKSKPWLRKFVEIYKKEIGRPFACNTRPETVTEELVKILREANCVLIAIGIESGDENLRAQVLRRRMSDERIVQAFDLIHRYGIKSASFNMVGIPGETRELFRKTIALNARIKPDLIQHTIFYPYRGTALGEMAHRNGYVVRDGYPTYFGRGTLSLPGFSLRQIEREALFFEYNVYKHVNRKRAVRGLIQSFGRRYPRLYQTAKKSLVRLRLWHSGAWHRPDVSVMGSDSRVSTRPTAGLTDAIKDGIGHAAGQ